MQDVSLDSRGSIPHVSQPTSAVSAKGPDSTPRYLVQGFDPSNVPPDQLLTARTARSLTAAQWLHHNIKYGLMGFVRQFKMLGIMINLYRHDFSIESIKDAAEKSEGGLLVKVIQFMCSSPHILTHIFQDDAQRFLNTLSHVSSNNKPMSRQELEFCLKQAGVPYDPERLHECSHLGTGSVGDVKEITLVNGERQVVKLISPTSEVRICTDLKMLRFFLGLIDFFKPGKVGQGTRYAINEFFESVRDELSLVKEAHKTQKQGCAFQALRRGDHFNITDEEMPNCAPEIPKPIDRIDIPFPGFAQGLSIPVNYQVPTISEEQLTPRTMCMEKINGSTLSDTDSEKLRGVAAQLFTAEPGDITDGFLENFRQYLKNLAHLQWLHCYVQTGFFNGDMHDGNVMVAIEGGQLTIYFIDLGNGQSVCRDVVKATLTINGAMEELRRTDDEQTREAYIEMIIGNIKSMGKYDPNEADWERLKTHINNLLPYGSRPGPRKVLDLFDFASSCNVHMPKEIVSLFRANILIGSQDRINICNGIWQAPALVRILRQRYLQGVSATLIRP